MNKLMDGVLTAAAKGRGGVGVKHNKNTAETPVERMPVPERVVLPMQQHIGAPCVPTVKVGDKVAVGQVIGDSDKFVFNLVDALTAGDRGKALELTENIIREGDSVMGTLALLTKQFEIMYDSLELSDKGMSMAAMAKETGVHEFRFKKAYNAARGYGRKTIKSLLISLYDIDKDIKNGNMEGDVALELFAIKAAR